MKMKKIIMLLIVLSFCILDVKAQDSISFSKNNVDTIYSVLYKKTYDLGEKCDSITYQIKYGGKYHPVIIDLMDTTNTNTYFPRKNDKVNILNNHAYHIYIPNEECIYILILIHNNKAYFFDKYEDISDTTQWEIDSVDYNYHLPPDGEFGVIHIFRFKKINALLDFINREGIKYTDEELFRIKHFNSTKWRMRYWK